MNELADPSQIAEVKDEADFVDRALDGDLNVVRVTVKTGTLVVFRETLEAVRRGK